MEVFTKENLHLQMEEVGESAEIAWNLTAEGYIL